MKIKWIHSVKVKRRLNTLQRSITRFRIQVFLPVYTLFLLNFQTRHINDKTIRQKSPTDVRDIGSVAAIILTHITQHINKAYDLTSAECLSFSEMGTILIAEPEPVPHTNMPPSRPHPSKSRFR